MVWLTDARLVAAVGNAGGMGVLGPNAGQTVVTRDAEGTAGNMRAEIRKVRELTDAPFAVNALPTQGREDIYTPPMLKVIYEEKVPAVVFVGEPDEAMLACSPSSRRITLRSSTARSTPRRQTHARPSATARTSSSPRASTRAAPCPT